MRGGFGHVALPGLLLLAAAGAGVAAGEELGSKQVVQRVERRYNRLRTMEADFVQRYTLGPTTLVESGRVYFQKPGRMRWEYNSPEEKLFLTDGKFAYFYIPAERQARRSKLKESAQWQATFALLLGRVDFGKVFDRVDLVPVSRTEDATRWQLRGTARSDKQGFYQIWFDLNERFQILRIEIQQRDGGLMEFHFRRWKENSVLSPDMFRLNVPSGTAWIDEGDR